MHYLWAFLTELKCILLLNVLEVKWYLLEARLLRLQVIEKVPSVTRSILLVVIQRLFFPKRAACVLIICWTKNVQPGVIRIRVIVNERKLRRLRYCTG